MESKKVFKMSWNFLKSTFKKFFKKEKVVNQVQKSGAYSINMQSARDINLNLDGKER